MKLKKIASLMLAGTMAVSMLVGCSNGSNGGNNNSNGNTVVEPSTSSIVTAFNNGQDEDNKVKVTFSSDAALDAALKKAVENAGDYNANADIGGVMIDLLGKSYDPSLFASDTSDNQIKDKSTRTVFGVYATDSSLFWSEADVVDYAARQMNEAVAELAADNKNAVTDDNEGDKYFTFSYTGAASMVSAEEQSGATVYYIAFTITQTAAEQTVKA